MGPDRGAEHVVGGLDVRHPVPDGLIHRIFQRAGAALDGSDFSAEQFHPMDVRRLALDVLGSHVDDAFQPELRAYGGGGHAMLAGAGLGDDPLAAHPLGEQALPERVVDLVRAGMSQVLAFQDDVRTAFGLADPLGRVYRRWAVGVGAAGGVKYWP